MLHNILRKYHCEYKGNTIPNENDCILFFEGDNISLLNSGEEISFPKLTHAEDMGIDKSKLIYLFSIDETAFFLHNEKFGGNKSFEFTSINKLRNMEPQWLKFAGITAYHLSYWYERNKYCGKCAAPFETGDSSRVLICPDCGNRKYPDISPVVIVGIKNKDKILLTKYSSGNYKRYGLIAGFVEIGEPLEDAVSREVYEEVGLKIKNIQYYDNQPWGFSRSLLVGFFADLDGSDDITLDKNELSEAVWLERSQIPESDANISLTAKMMNAFKNSEII